MIKDWIEAGAETVIALCMGAFTYMRCREYIRAEEERRDKIARDAEMMLTQQAFAEKYANQAVNAVPMPIYTSSWQSGNLQGAIGPQTSITPQQNP